MEFKDRLVAAREQAELTQEELAKICGLSTSAIANYERGARIPRKEAIEKLAAALKLDKNYLLTGVKNREAIVDTFIESLYNSGVIKGDVLDDTTRDMILKVVEAKLIQLKNENDK